MPFYLLLIHFRCWFTCVVLTLIHTYLFIYVYAGAEIDCEDKSRNTALHIAARYGHELIITALVKHGASTAKLVTLTIDHLSIGPTEINLCSCNKHKERWLHILSTSLCFLLSLKIPLHPRNLSPLSCNDLSSVPSTFSVEAFMGCSLYTWQLLVASQIAVGSCCPQVH